MARALLSDFDRTFVFPWFIETIVALFPIFFWKIRIFINPVWVGEGALFQSKLKAQSPLIMANHSPSTISIVYDGTPYSVSNGRTILAALDGAGLEFVRGVGLRWGACGDFTILLRMQGSLELTAGLLWQGEVLAGFW